MQLQGSRQLAVTQQQAWQALNDPEVLKLCIPGCDSIEATGEHRYQLSNAIKVGPVAAKFKGTLQLADLQAPDRYTIHFEGNGGAAGFGKGSARVALTPLPTAGCELGYQVNATVGGKIAQVGQRLIDGVAKSMAESFFTRFDEEMQRRHPAPALPQTPAPAVGDAPAGGVPTWVWVALVVALLLAAVWALR